MFRELVLLDLAEKADVGMLARKPAVENPSQFTLPKDEQLDIGHVRDHAKQRLDAFQRNDPPGEDDPARLFCLGGRGSFKRGEERQNLDRCLNAVRAVHLGRELARRKQAIERTPASGREAGVAPQLRRQARADRAAEARPLVAGVAAVLPQRVRRADQPMIVKRHDPRPRLPHAQHAGPAHQRDVVEMEDVEWMAEKGVQRRRVERRRIRSAD